MVASKEKRTLTRDDWLAKALDFLETQGIGGVRVLRLAQALGVTRGSFYWHFRDRQDLLDAMLKYWDQELTDSVIRHVESMGGKESGERIFALGEFVILRGMSRCDSAMRAWARDDKRAGAVVRLVIRKRLRFVEGLFRDAGFPPDEARARGRVLAVYIMGESIILAGEPKKERLRLLKRQVHALTRKD